VIPIIKWDGPSRAAVVALAGLVHVAAKPVERMCGAELAAAALDAFVAVRPIRVASLRQFVRVLIEAAGYLDDTCARFEAAVAADAASQKGPAN